MNRRRFTGIWIFLTMLPVASPVSADAVVESRSYNYSEGWALVSAPPPPGPYMAINLDPRIPGQDLLPMLPVKESANAVVSEIPADSIPVEALENPPAAGMPVMPESGQSPAADLNAAGAALPPPVPGRYNRMMPAYNYPAAPRYPVRTGFPNYRSTPPMGYYGGAVPRTPQQVPPPPVYDATINERRYYASPGWEGRP
jgi:hypothetical protein